MDDIYSVPSASALNTTSVFILIPPLKCLQAIWHINLVRARFLKVFYDCKYATNHKQNPTTQRSGVNNNREAKSAIIFSLINPQFYTL